MRENMAIREMKQCYFCGEECNEEDFCYWCKAYICEECIGKALEAPWGNHFPEDHRIGEEEDEEE